MKNWIITIKHPFGTFNYRDESFEHALRVIATHKELYPNNEVKLAHKEYNGRKQ